MLFSALVGYETYVYVYFTPHDILFYSCYSITRIRNRLTKKKHFLNAYAAVPIPDNYRCTFFINAGIETTGPACAIPLVPKVNINTLGAQWTWYIHQACKLIHVISSSTERPTIRGIPIYMIPRKCGSMIVYIHVDFEVVEFLVPG